jgi:hypothetical protein
MTSGLAAAIVGLGYRAQPGVGPHRGELRRSIRGDDDVAGHGLKQW